MDKDSFTKLCKTYKELILEVVNHQYMTPAQFSESPWSKNYKKAKYNFKIEGKEAVYLERIRSIDKDFRDAVNKFQNTGQRFCGYDWGGGHLVKTYYNVLDWIDSIKQAKGLKHGLDITNAILQEMEQQERGKGLTLAPAAEESGKKTPSYQWGVNEQNQKVVCNKERSGKLERRLFETYKKLFENKGQKVKITSLPGSRDKACENVRKLKAFLRNEYKIDKKAMDRIIEPISNNKGKYTAFIFR